MASKVIVLALVFVAIVGLASAAQEPAPSTTLPAESPMGDDVIGNDDGSAAGAPSGDGSTVVPGPMGSVGSAESATSAGGPSESPKSDAALLKFSAITGVATVAGYLFI